MTAALLAIGAVLVAAIAALLISRGRRRDFQGPPDYSCGETLNVPHDGAELDYSHPLGWPVRIVQRIPVAVGPDGRAARWSPCVTAWIGCDGGLADEARERLRLEETQVDLPVARPTLTSRAAAALLSRVTGLTEDEAHHRIASEVVRMLERARPVRA